MTRTVHRAAPAAIGAVLGLLLATAAQAQHTGHAMGAAPASPPAANIGSSTEAYRSAMETMHRDMNIPYTGDADRDFVAGMLPHHRGAVDMARIQLRFGKDPELRRLAQEIVTAQEKEIAILQRWQAQHPAPR